MLRSTNTLSLNPLAGFAWYICSTLLLVSGALTAIGCSQLRASSAPTSPFLASPLSGEPDRLQSSDPGRFDPGRFPWDAAWSANPGHIMVNLPEVRTLFIDPVNTQYLNMVTDADGTQKLVYKLDPSTVTKMANLFHQELVDKVKNAPGTNLKLVENRNRAMLILQPALIQLVPTSVVTNSVADTLGLIIPGSKAVAETVSVGVQAGGGTLAAGTVAMEFKIIDGKSGQVLAEAKDRENDSASILPNYRDFEEFGWTEQTIENWSAQFVQVFSTDASTKVDSSSDISVAPW